MFSFVWMKKAKGEAYCANMKRFQDYCAGRRNREGPVAYMVSDETSMEEGTDEDDGLLMYLDSGCNSTCHGQKWMERYERLTGYRPEWLSKIAKNMTGIGGSTRSLGTRRLYVGLETQEGYHVPGELVSTEIEGSMAPMLLSLQAQESLGMIVDLANGIVTSQTLGCTFRAVRGKKNRLIGLRLQPGDYLDDDSTIPVSLMADQEDDEDQRRADRRPETKMTHQVKEVPRRRGYYDRDSASSTDAPIGAGRGGSTPPWRRGDPETPPSKKGRMPSSGPSSSSAQAPLQEEWIEEEPQNDEEYVMVAHEEQGAEGAEEEEEIEVEVEVEPEEPEEEAHEETRSEAERRRFVSERERRGYLDREAVYDDDLEEDFWELTDESLIRHHFERRFDFFYPNDSLGELPIDVSRIGSIRITNRKFVGTVDSDEVVDFWKDQRFPPANTEKPWIGSTEFKLVPIEEELRSKKLDLEDGHKKVMTKGQKKRLAKEAQQLEDEDHAMWSVLRGQKPLFPPGWKSLMEIFAGCAVLTSVFQAGGYDCCTPVDILSGWDVFKAEDRRRLEERIRHEQPYLLSLCLAVRSMEPLAAH